MPATYRRYGVVSEPRMTSDTASSNCHVVEIGPPPGTAVPQRVAKAKAELAAPLQVVASGSGLVGVRSGIGPP